MGDGKQIQHGNGLAVKDADGKDYLAQEYDKNVPSSGVDVILANPPFGSTEEDQEILSKYSLSSLKKIAPEIINIQKKKQKIYLLNVPGNY